jgi:hypothetical protein
MRHLNWMVSILLAASASAQQNVRVDDIDIFDILTMQSGSRFTGHILPLNDNAYDIGGSGENPRLRAGFAYSWNAETFSITDTSHLQHFQLQQDETGPNQELDIEDPANNPMMTFEAGFRVRLYEDIVPDSSVRGAVDNGTAADYWDEMWADNIIALKGLHPAVPLVSLNPTAQGGRLTIATDSIFSPQFQLQAYVSSAGGGAIDLFNAGSEKVIELLSGAAGGGQVIARSTGIGIGRGTFSVENSANQNLATLTHVGSNGFLGLADTSGVSAQLINRNVTKAGQLETNTDFIPNAANLHNIGVAGREWLNVYGNFFKVRSTAGTCTLVSGAGAPGGACNTCDVAVRTDGGVGTTLYVCEAGSWVGK